MTMLVSVCMPTRNRVRLLDKAIDSVLSQTYSNIELIVVNDASSDGTEDYLQSRSQNEPRLTYYSNAVPRGASASRNIAISRSKGEFVTGLDDDDQFLADRVGAFVDYWKLLTSSGVKPSCIYAQSVLLRNGVQFCITQNKGFVSAEDLFEHNYIGIGMFAPRAHFIEAGLFDEQLPAWVDLEFNIRLLAKFGRAHLLDMATYLFDVTIRPDRVSSQEKKVRDAFEIVANKHSTGLPHKTRALFLQMFHYDYYRIKPTIPDCIRFLRLGGRPRELRSLLRTMIRPIKSWPE